MAGLVNAQDFPEMACIAPHVCTTETCPEPGKYFVTAVEGGNFWKMSGPYPTHAAALTDVDRALHISHEHDARAWWNWGTVRMADDCQDIGILQKHGLMELPA